MSTLGTAYCTMGLKLPSLPIRLPVYLSTRLQYTYAPTYHRSHHTVRTAITMPSVFYNDICTYCINTTTTYSYNNSFTVNHLSPPEYRGNPFLSSRSLVTFTLSHSASAFTSTINITNTYECLPCEKSKR